MKEKNDNKVVLFKERYIIFINNQLLSKLEKELK